jgi:hypothetical protein
MSLVPVEKHGGKKKPLNESERNKLRREKERADWNNRNNRDWKR